MNVTGRPKGRPDRFRPLCHAPPAWIRRVVDSCDDSQGSAAVAPNDLNTPLGLGRSCPSARPRFWQVCLGYPASWWWHGRHLFMTRWEASRWRSWRPNCLSRPRWSRIATRPSSPRGTTARPLEMPSKPPRRRLPDRRRSPLSMARAERGSRSPFRTTAAPTHQRPCSIRNCSRPRVMAQSRKLARTECARRRVMHSRASYRRTRRICRSSPS